VRGALAVRRLRPPLSVRVTLTGGRPVHLQSDRLTARIVASVGPWRSSGEWWTERPWIRDEWDAELPDGTLCRSPTTAPRGGSKHLRLSAGWSDVRRAARSQRLQLSRCHAFAGRHRRRGGAARAAGHGARGHGRRVRRAALLSRLHPSRRDPARRRRDHARGGGRLPLLSRTRKATAISASS
jgi:hypothetical protein